jgi:hypothetical protein
MYETYHSKEYHEYLKEMKQYEKSILKSHGRNCSTCRHYSILLVEDKFRHYCKMTGQEKEKNDRCIFWTFNRPARFSESEFYNLSKMKKSN